MHDSDSDGFERLASYADVLAGELPGTWASTSHPAEDKDDLAELTDRIWDLDLVAQSLTEHPLRQAAVLTRPDGAQLALLDRHDGRDGFLIAAVAPRTLPDEAYRGVREPNGIALTDDPFLGAERVAGDLLPRYDSALAQARHNAAPDIHPSRLDQVVLTWQNDGALAAAPVGQAAAAVLEANGFIPDEHSGIYRLSGDDTAAQAHAVYHTGQQLAAAGITVALQHSPGRSGAPTATAPATPPSTVSRTTTSRAR